VRYGLDLFDLNLGGKDADGDGHMHRLRPTMPQVATAEGENPTVEVGLFLQFLLKALAHPFASFHLHFLFDLPQ
jgi:ABC-type tungstate transport system substrate-binding protein